MIASRTNHVSGAGRRRRFLLSCAITAIAAATPAGAQVVTEGGAFQGSASIGSGVANRLITGPTTETITVGTPTATLNWSPYDTQGSGPIDFLPVDHVATFVNDPQSTTDFTILNRIIPTDPNRAIVFNGSVFSQIQDLAQNVSTGGKVWFYSPGGIVVGAQSVFNVGGLLLTANDVTNFSAAGGTFTANPGSNASVVIRNGAAISALSEGSYVAVVAPRVEQHGIIDVNGSAALVAGEQVSLTMNQGLFDIRVDVGTTDANGVVHTGTTGGTASSGASDRHGIYMVAVPKNEALTMLLQGDIGYQPATNASVENGVVILSAGYREVSLFPDNPIGSRIRSLSSAGSVESNVILSSANVTSAVEGQATHDFSIRTVEGDSNYAQHVAIYGGRLAEVSASDGRIGFGGDLKLNSFADGLPGETRLFAGVGGIIDIAGQAVLQSGIPFNKSRPSAWELVAGTASVMASGGSISAASLDVQSMGPSHETGDVLGGVAQIGISDGGTLSVAGNVQVRSSATSFAGNTAFGGDSAVWLNGGTMTVGGNLTVTAGADNAGTSPSGGSAAVGGDASIVFYWNGGTMTVAGQTSVDASARGARGDNLQADGGSASGGHAFVVNYSDDPAASMTFANLVVSASARGGDGVTAGTGGDATGGLAQLYSDGPGRIAVTGVTRVTSSASGGNGQTGGNAQGGNADIQGVDGTIALGPTIVVTATGIGGNANVGVGGNGGDGRGGAAGIEALAEPGNVEVLPSAAMISGGTATVDTSGFGGSGGVGALIDGVLVAAGNGGNGQGGAYLGENGSGGAFAAAQTDGAVLQLGTTMLASGGFGGAGGTGVDGQTGGAGGTGTGGSVQAGLYDPFGTQANSGSASYGDLTLQAAANGGSGGQGGSGQGAGGSAFGGGSGGESGGAFLNAKGEVETGTLQVIVTANGGNGGTGGNAEAGFAQIAGYGGGSLLVGGNLSIDARGFGGSGASGAGGSSTGGGAYLYALSESTISVSGGLTFDVGASGGLGLTGGSGDGGVTLISGEGGNVDVAGAARLAATGHGGAASQGIGGRGQGGEGIVDAFGASQLAFGSLSLDTDGVGGAGTSLGGEGLGGNVGVIAANASIDAGSSLNGTARGTGGNATQSGGTGGYGGGGVVSIAADVGGTIATSGQLTVRGSGLGGDSVAGGGQGEGGSVYIDLAGGSVTAGRVQLFANGEGGDGLEGGRATGGTAMVTIDSLIGGSFTVIGPVEMAASGHGGAGIANAEGAGGTGGSGFGGYSGLLFGGGTATVGEVSAQANGNGGNGGVGTDGAGGDGGDGIGGTIELQLGGAMIGTRYLSNANGRGGAGGAGTIAGEGGSAGGGLNSLSVDSGALARFSSIVALDASAVGGSGGNGGDAFAGRSTYTVSGELAASGVGAAAEAQGGHGSATSGGNAHGGGAGMIIAGGTTAISSLVIRSSAIGGNGNLQAGGGYGGEVYLNVLDTTVDLGPSVTLRSNGRGGIGGAAGDSIGGVADLFVSGATVAVGNVTLNSSGERGGDVSLDLYGSTIVADSITLDASGLSVGGDVDIYVGTLGGLATTLQTATFDAIAFGGDTGGSIDLILSPDSQANLGNATFSAGSDFEDGSVTFTLGGQDNECGTFCELLGPVTFGDAMLNAQSIQVESGLFRIVSQDGSGVDVADDFTVVASGHVIFTDNAGGAVIEADVLDIQAFGFDSNFELLTNDLSIRTVTTLSLGDIGAGRTILLTSDGDVNSGSLQAPDSIEVIAGGFASLGDVSSDVVGVEAGSGFSLANVSAAQIASFTTSGTANFSGLVSAPQISVTSFDINIGEGGRLGVIGITDLIELFAVSEGMPVLVGGADSGGESEQYHLSMDEADRIEAREIEFTAIGAGDASDPDIIIDTIEMFGSLTPGGGTARVGVATGGSVIVIGSILYGDASATDTLSILAGNRIIVDSSSEGLIALFNGPEGSELPSGILRLTAPDVWMANATILDSLVANQNYAGRDAALAVNNAPARPYGHAAAGQMVLSVSDSLFVQNSGTSTTFGGLTVSPNGLSIIPAGQQAISVTAFGSAVGPNGTTTNNAFFQTVNFNPSQAAGYSAASTLNGCSINLGCAGAPPPPPPPPPEPQPAPPIVIGGPGVVLGPVDSPATRPMTLFWFEPFGGEVIGWIDETGEQEDGSLGGIPLSAALRDTDGPLIDSLLDQRVTSGGDSHLWFDENDDEEDEDDEADKGE